VVDEQGLTPEAAARLSGPAARALIRAGRWRRTTAGLAVGWEQANLVILPAALADDFRRFCERNPQACPLLDVTEPGSPEPRAVAPSADLRTDVPRYRVYRDGALADEVDDLTALWRPDFVGFLLGCSFTADAALLRAGVPLRHLEQGTAVAMYRTSRPCEPAGPFHGPIVVSMRPVPADLVERAAAVTARYPRAHGAPLQVGEPAALGIADLTRPDYGDVVPVGLGELPMFWACGVTPQAAAEAARIELMITHAPGHMFVTDLRDEGETDG
jgi:uncharacterized protein YcsI (UPF0317 family)